MSMSRIVAAVAAATLCVAAWSSAGAAVLPVVPHQLCDAQGTVALGDGSSGSTTWTVHGTGGCTDVTGEPGQLLCSDRYGNPCDPGPEPDMTFAGSGTSTGAGGTCGQLVVSGFRIAVTLQVPTFFSDPFFGISGWELQTVRQIWVAPRAAFPGVTQFRILDAKTGALSGVGAIADTARQKCAPESTTGRYVLLFG
jgi:hypothetical protein